MNEKIIDHPARLALAFISAIVRALEFMIVAAFTGRRESISISGNRGKFRVTLLVFQMEHTNFKAHSIFLNKIYIYFIYVLYVSIYLVGFINSVKKFHKSFMCNKFEINYAMTIQHVSLLLKYSYVKLPTLYKKH